MSDLKIPIVPIKMYHIGVWDFENGISSRQFKAVNLILVKKITNDQFLKWNKCDGGQSLIRNYVPAQFLIAIDEML